MTNCCVRQPGSQWNMTLKPAAAPRKQGSLEYRFIVPVAQVVVDKNDIKVVRYQEAMVRRNPE